MVEQPDHTDDGGRIDCGTLSFVVETDVAAGDRYAQRATGRTHALHGLRELPHDRRTLGIAEVQAIGRRQRTSAGARHVARRLGDREHGAVVRIEVTVAAVAVDRHRQRAFGAFDAHDAGTHAGQIDRVGADHVVVLAIDPALAGDGR